MNTYECGTKSQCRDNHGSTNDYLEEPRAIEIFLKDIEPKYNEALDSIRERKPNSDTVFTIAGLAAYIEGCSPGGVRISQKVMQGFAEAQGSLIKAKNADGGQTHLAEVNLSDESLKPVTVKVKSKYAQSFGITGLLRRLYLLGNSNWDFIINDSQNSQFLTSDFPIAFIDSSVDARFNDRIFVLAPDLAVLIRTNIDYQYNGVNRFKEFKYRFSDASRRDVMSINKAIVRCAESTIYYRDESDWVFSFVKKNRHFRIEPKFRHVSNGESDYIITEIVVEKYTPLSQ